MSHVQMNQSPLPANEASNEIKASVESLQADFRQVREQLAQVIVGMDDVIEQLMIGILCRSHCILQGMPGLAKTLLISRIADLMDLRFHRIQFTPDLMPADITGSEVLQENRSTGEREFRFIKGPIFCNLILADEINRTPPKTQSALLEAMEERQLSVSGQTYDIPDPFFVLATQNPIEVEGTYPLPEAQLDRFLFKIKVSYPSREDEKEICRRQVSDYSGKVQPVFDIPKLLEVQSMVPKVVAADHCFDLAVDLARCTRPEEGQLPGDLRDKVQYGAGPRASIAMLLAAKARALLNGRVHVLREDITAVAVPVLRHRVIPSFNAEAAGVDTDAITSQIIQQVSK